MIDVRIIADSLNSATEDRLTTFLLTYPRYIHAEVMTHRMFSRNAASSRAIPVAKFRKDVMENPVIPSHWGSNQKGMQAGEELDNTKADRSWWPEEPDVDGSSLPVTKVTARELAQNKWLAARDRMLKVHLDFEALGLHKQIANRIIEPWFHIQLLVSATDYENYFSLRCHKDAHPDIQSLADAMLFEYVNTTPIRKDPGEWHLPFGDQHVECSEGDLIKVCVARAARLSYRNFEKAINLQDDLELHDKLKASGHWSPFEHPAQAMKFSDMWSGNFRGWKQYRKFFDGENRRIDLKALLEMRQKEGTVYAKGPVTTVG